MQTIDPDNPTSIWILGTLIFENYEVCYDYEHKKIGWRKKQPITPLVLSTFTPTITRGKPITLLDTSAKLDQCHIDGSTYIVSSFAQ